MKSKTVRLFVASLALVFVFGLVPAAALAHDGERHDHDESTSDEKPVTTLESRDGEDRRDSLKTRLEEFRQERQEKKEQRLEAAKLKVCEQRKAKIQAIMNRSITRAERQLELFDTITNRVKTFYQDKGYSLDNYDELVAAVDTAKAEAEANLAVLKGMDGFDCDADDPKGNAEAFKLALQTIRQDLKDYRSAVNNLIVAVKSANPNGEGSEQ